jgi:hypothetical protein
VRITLATLVYSQPPSYFPYAERINRRYCETHGYRFEIFTPHEQSERSPLWFTVCGVRELLPDSDLVLYIDADAYTWDPTKTVESLVAEHMGDAAILAGSDRKNQRQGWSDTNANLGVFAVRRSDAAFRLLDQWWNAPRRYDERWFWKWPLHQGAFNFIIRPLAPEGLIKVIPYHFMNGTDGTFIRHLALEHDDERRELLRRECERLCGQQAGGLYER